MPGRGASAAAGAAGCSGGVVGSVGSLIGAYFARAMGLKANHSLAAARPFPLRRGTECSRECLGHEGTHALVGRLPGRCGVRPEWRSVGPASRWSPPAFFVDEAFDVAALVAGFAQAFEMFA